MMTDLIIKNATVRTMDATTPLASAVAVKKGRIVALGSDEEMQSLRGQNTRVIDANGHLLLPGFQDSHVHFQMTSADLYHSVSLYEAESLEDMLCRIKEFADKNPSRPWIRGVGFNTILFTPEELTKEALDRATGNRPAFIFAADYHNGWANTLALEIAGVRQGSADPENGEFLRNADGTPTGWVVEDAVWTMHKLSPQYTPEDYLAGMKHFSRQFNAKGVTGVLDAMAPRSFMENYQASHDAGELTLRVCATAKIFAHLPLEQQLTELKELRDRYKGDRVRFHSAKFFIDGIMENGTAALLAPRTDNGQQAALMFTQEQIDEYFAEFDKAKFQLHVHTIGDAAIRATLDGIERAREQNGAWDSRHQLAHLHVVDPEDIPRFAKLGVLGNFQGYWCQPQPENDAAISAMLGKNRSAWLYPIGALVNSGATCMLSSDWGVTTFDPFQIIEAAVTRQNQGATSESPSLLPQFRITIEDAVRGYTVNAAYASWRDDCTGSISVGKYADMILLDQDLFDISPYEIHKTQVLLTLLEGEEVYRSDTFAG